MNINKLNSIIPNNVLVEIPNVVSKFKINNELRLAHFLSQCSHESMGFKAIRENLNYSAAALHSVFGKYFDNIDMSSYVRNPEKIANRVYANRMGNGSEQSGDGWNFRGRGYIQLTGKDNYFSFGRSIGVDLTSNPDLIATHYPLLSAAWFFYECGLNTVADLGSSNDVIAKITKRINGGTNGLADRITQFNKIYLYLTK